MNDTKPTAPARWGRSRDANKDRTILAAMLDMVVRYGFDDASFEKVATPAGVSRATIYRRWMSKEALLIHALDAQLRSERRHEFACDRGLPDIKDKIAAFAELLAEPYSARVITVLIAESSARPKFAQLLSGLEQERRALMRQAIAAAIDLAQIAPPADVDEAIDAIVGASTSGDWSIAVRRQGQSRTGSSIRF